MATAKRWRGVIVGRFNSGLWQGEEAQMGVGGWLSDSDPNWTSPAIDTPLPTATVNPGGGVEVVAGLGTVNYGAEGAGASGFSKTNQKSIAGLLRDYVNALKAFQANTFSWQEVRLSAFQADGKVINGATVVVLETPIVGTDSTQDLPPQTAVVQSLTTSGRGARNRGRIYIPIHSSNAAASGSGTVATSTQTTVNNAGKALWDALEALTHIGPAVVSPTHQSFSELVTFRVGNRFDTQRRRAGGVRESFATVTN